jgi:hypothetical protein
VTIEGAINHAKAAPHVKIALNKIDLQARISTGRRNNFRNMA